MGKGYFSVPFELLKELLYLPDGTELIDVHTDDEDRKRRMFTVVVSHPDIPKVPATAKLIRVNPNHQVTFENIYDGETRNIILFKDWGLPE